MRVVTVIINDIFTDQRVRKQIEVINSLGYDTTVACRRQVSRNHIENCEFKIRRFSFIVNKGPLFYLSFNLRLFFYLLFKRFDLIVSNDLDTLLPCFLVSKCTGRSLVYDAHEYFTGQYGLDKHRLPYKVWKYIERRIIPDIRHMITVSDSIARLYTEEYGVNPVVIRNLSYFAGDIIPAERKSLGIPGDVFLVVLQGAGMNPGRGVSELLEAIRLTDGVHLLLIGSGDSIDELKRIASASDLKEKVTFLPRMNWHEMISYTKMCDAGLSLDKSLSINQEYSLPNKLFDYLSAGIPVITSSLPEIKRIVDKYKCGILVSDVNPDTVSEAIRTLRDNEMLWHELRKGAEEASAVLNWEKERAKQIEFFKNIPIDLLSYNGG